MQFVKSTSTFELPPEGNQPAVIAEVGFAMIENRFSKRKEKEKELKLVLSFELAAENKKGERFIKDIELFPQITTKNMPGKLLASLAGYNEKTLLSQEKLNAWVYWLLGDYVQRNDEGELILDEEARFQTKEFEEGSTEEDLIRWFNKMTEPPCVGKTCFVQIVYNENETSGKTYANIKNLYANAKLNDNREVMRDPETKKMIPAFQLQLSGKYVPYAKRMKEMQDRMNSRSNGDSKPAATKSKKTEVEEGDIPF